MGWPVVVREPDGGRVRSLEDRPVTIMLPVEREQTPGSPRPISDGECDCLSTISTGQLHPSRGFHVRPIDHVFCMGSPGARWPHGILILEQASRLDAFSGYPFRT